MDKARRVFRSRPETWQGWEAGHHVPTARNVELIEQFLKTFWKSGRPLDLNFTESASRHSRVSATP
jgi:hypothetical protein